MQAGRNMHTTTNSQEEVLLPYTRDPTWLQSNCESTEKKKVVLSFSRALKASGKFFAGGLGNAHQLFQMANARETQRSAHQELSIHESAWEIYLPALLLVNKKLLGLEYKGFQCKNELVPHQSTFFEASNSYRIGKMECLYFPYFPQTLTSGISLLISVSADWWPISFLYKIHGFFCLAHSLF